jgi:hypothetical protein
MTSHLIYIAMRLETFELVMLTSKWHPNLVSILIYYHVSNKHGLLNANPSRLSNRFRIAAVYSNNDNKVGPNSDKFILQKETAMKRPTFVPVVITAAPHNSTSVVLRWKVFYI